MPAACLTKVSSAVVFVVRHFHISQFAVLGIVSRCIGTQILYRAVSINLIVDVWREAVLKQQKISQLKIKSVIL